MSTGQAKGVQPPCASPKITDPAWQLQSPLAPVRRPCPPRRTSVDACPGVRPPSCASFALIFSTSVLRLEIFHSRFLRSGREGSGQVGVVRAAAFGNEV
jgi:hypothetical protein